MNNPNKEAQEEGLPMARREFVQSAALAAAALAAAGRELLPGGAVGGARLRVPAGGSTAEDPRRHRLRAPLLRAGGL